MEKKGYDVLLRALALLPRGLAWRFEHIGGGEALAALKALADELGIADADRPGAARSRRRRCWTDYRQADLFALACRVAADGDRDGLPNVLVEAASQRPGLRLHRVSGVPELLGDGENGLLVPPDDPAALGRSARTGDPRSCAARAARRRRRDAGARPAFDHLPASASSTTLFEREWQRRHE